MYLSWFELKVIFFFLFFFLHVLKMWKFHFCYLIINREEMWIFKSVTGMKCWGTCIAKLFFRKLFPYSCLKGFSLTIHLDRFSELLKIYTARNPANFFFVVLRMFYKHSILFMGMWKRSIWWGSRSLNQLWIQKAFSLLNFSCKSHVRLRPGRRLLPHCH